MLPNSATRKEVMEMPIDYCDSYGEFKGCDYKWIDVPVEQSKLYDAGLVDSSGYEALKINDDVMRPLIASILKREKPSNFETEPYSLSVNGRLWVTKVVTGNLCLSRETIETLTNLSKKYDPQSFIELEKEYLERFNETKTEGAVRYLSDRLRIAYVKYCILNKSILSPNSSLGEFNDFFKQIPTLTVELKKYALNIVDNVDKKGGKYAKAKRGEKGKPALKGAVMGHDIKAAYYILDCDFKGRLVYSSSGRSLIKQILRDLNARKLQ